MTIDEAIKTTELAISYAHFSPHSKQEEALRLGIEALRLILWQRYIWHPVGPSLLPGETEE